MPQGRLRIPLWAALALTVLTVALGLLVGTWARSRFDGGDEVKAVAYGSKPRKARPRVVAPPAAGPVKTDAKETMPAASAGLNHPHPHPDSHRTPNRSQVGAPAAVNSFAGLEGSIDGTIGLAVAPLGAPQDVQSFGPLQVGHAWSSMKVPIVVTLMRNGEFGGEDEELARAAITASDNEAAAALFSHLEATHGGVTGASAAVGETLAAAGDTATQIATAPPPPGAVSTWGQTEWSAGGSVAFYGALACGQLIGSSETEAVITLMQEVISEQRWGLGQAPLPSGGRVAFKAGWGPDGETGGYLVRQAGIVWVGSSGLAVTMLAEDASGSFEAGIADIDRIADWVGENLDGLGMGRC